MRFRVVLSLAKFFLVCFTMAVLAQPMTAEPQSDGTPRNQSVSGKIASVGDAVFTVSIAKDKQAPQNVEFFVDDKTRVEGKLKVGAGALVEYRSDSGRNIAVHVVVTPVAGAHLYSGAALD